MTKEQYKKYDKILEELQPVKAYEKIPDKWIPVIMAICGGALGVAGLYTMPDFPAGDVINAIAVGMASGLAATGVNQLYKQQCK